MAYVLRCRTCEWAIEEPIELKGEANWLAGQHIAETGHSVALERVDLEGEDFYRGGDGEVVIEAPPGIV